MPEHLTERQFALYIEGKLNESESCGIHSHLSECPECAHIFIDMVSLADLKTAGLLQGVTPDELQWAENTLSALLKSAISQTNVKGDIGGQVQTLGDKLKGLLGNAPLLPGLFALPTAMGSQATGRLALAKGEGVLHSNDRNHDNSASHMMESNHGFPLTMGEYAVSNTTSDTDIHPADLIIGQPGVGGTSDYVEQHYPDTCAIQCQRIILNGFGIPVSETQLAHEAQEKGFYTPGQGTNMEDVGKLLEEHGVGVHRVADANIFNLTAELAQGHQVIIGVEADELWRQHPLLTELSNLFGLSGADHAIIVSGIDTTDPNDVKVIVTDPGTGDVAKSYPLDQFVAAWKDSRCFMVATNEPAPSIMTVHAPTLEDPNHVLHPMLNFDEGRGHISHVGAVPYEMFSVLHDEAAQSDDPSHIHNLAMQFSALAQRDTGIDWNHHSEHMPPHLLDAMHDSSPHSGVSEPSTGDFFHELGMYLSLLAQTHDRPVEDGLDALRDLFSANPSLPLWKEPAVGDVHHPDEDVSSDHFGDHDGDGADL